MCIAVFNSGRTTAASTSICCSVFLLLNVYDGLEHESDKTPPSGNSSSHCQTAQRANELPYRNDHIAGCRPLYLLRAHDRSRVLTRSRIQSSISDSSQPTARAPSCRGRGNSERETARYIALRESPTRFLTSGKRSIELSIAFSIRTLKSLEV